MKTPFTDLIKETEKSIKDFKEQNWKCEQKRREYIKKRLPTSIFESGKSYKLRIDNVYFRLKEFNIKLQTLKLSEQIYLKDKQDFLKLSLGIIDRKMEMVKNRTQEDRIKICICNCLLAIKKELSNLGDGK